MRIDGGALFGTSYDTLGDIHLGLVTGGITIAIATNGPVLSAAVGPRLEAGWGWSSSHATTSGTVASSGGGAIVDAAFAFDLGVALGQDFRATADIAPGVVLRGLDVQADDRRAAGIGGVFVSVAVGVARAF